MYAIRQDGSRAQLSRRFISPDLTSNATEYRRVLDIPNRTDTGIDPFTKSLTSSPVSRHVLPSYTNPPSSSCTSQNDQVAPGGATIDPNPNPASIMGYAVIQFRHADTLPSGKHLVTTRWIAPRP